MKNILILLVLYVYNRFTLSIGASLFQTKKNRFRFFEINKYHILYKIIWALNIIFFGCGVIFVIAKKELNIIFYIISIFGIGIMVTNYLVMLMLKK